MAETTGDQQSRRGNEEDGTPRAGSGGVSDTGTDPGATDHPTGEAQAAANADNEAAG